MRDRECWGEDKDRRLGMVTGAGDSPVTVPQKTPPIALALTHGRQEAALGVSLRPCSSHQGLLCGLPRRPWWQGEALRGHPWASQRSCWALTPAHQPSAGT